MSSTIENNDNTIPFPETVQPQGVTDEVQAQANHIENLNMLQTHLQVSNLIKILFTIDFNILQGLVDHSPEELKGSGHYKVLLATTNFYNAIIEANKVEVPQE